MKTIVASKTTESGLKTLTTKKFSKNVYIHILRSKDQIRGSESAESPNSVGIKVYLLKVYNRNTEETNYYLSSFDLQMPSVTKLSRCTAFLVGALASQWTKYIFKASSNCLQIGLSRQDIYQMSTRQLKYNQLQTRSEMSRKGT